MGDAGGWCVTYFSLLVVWVVIAVQSSPCIRKMAQNRCYLLCRESFVPVSPARGVSWESFVPVRPARAASRSSFVPAIGTVCYAYDAAMFERLRSLFGRTLIGSAVGPWDERQFGDFRVWIENREHLRIVYTNSESKDNEPLAQCSFRAYDREVTVTRLEVARCARRVGWGTELILELCRRFPDCQISVSGIEIDPNGIAFWKKLSEEGLIVADELPDCEEILEMHRRAPTSLCRDTWEPPVQATDAARRVKAEYDQQLSVVLSRS